MGPLNYAFIIAGIPAKISSKTLDIFQVYLLYYKYKARAQTDKQKGHHTPTRFINVLFDKSPKTKRKGDELMLFFISPVSSLVQKLSNEKDLLVFLGLKGVTNSVNEFQLYYEKLFGFLIHHLDAAIAKIEADETVEEKPEIQQPAIPEIPGYTPEAVEAYESLFGEFPPSPAPAVEDVIEPATTTDTVETETTQEIDEELETETITDRMLKAKTKDELDAIKAENPEEVTKLWDTLSIPEKNQIKCIAKSPDGKKKPATLGYKFTYTDPNTKEKFEAAYLGYYLHGQALTDEDQRAITVKGKGLICSKKDLRPRRKQPLLAPGIQQYLEDVLSNPAKAEATVETKPTDTAVETDTPTASEMAENTFTGLVETPKKPQDGLMTGNKPGSQLSNQDAVQTTLDLKTPETEPETVEVIQPNKLLTALEQGIKKVNNELEITYEAVNKSTFLEVHHGKTKIGTFEYKGNDIWIQACEKMKHHGFTEAMIYDLADVEYLNSLELLECPKA